MSIARRNVFANSQFCREYSIDVKEKEGEYSHLAGPSYTEACFGERNFERAARARSPVKVRILQILTKRQSDSIAPRAFRFFLRDVTKNGIHMTHQ